MSEKLAFRAAMWWLVGWSNALSGEALIGDPGIYQDDYDRGFSAAKRR